MMKKRILGLIVLSMLIAGSVSAASINGDFKGNPIVKVKSAGNELKIDETPAYIDNGNTMVPLVMLRQLGVTVTWNADDYSVNVALPKSESQTNVDTLKKYAMTADYCVYLENAVRYIFNFSSSMDLYAKGSISSDQVYKEYSNNGTKVKELYDKAVKTSGIVNDAGIWGNINTYISGSYDIANQMQDAYIDVVAYRTAISQNEDKAVIDQSFNSYISKVKKAADQTAKLIDSIRTEYSTDMNTIIQ